MATILTVRLIQPNELAAFAAIGAQGGEAAEVQQYVERMIEKGSMRIDWCYVLEEDGNLCGRIGFWTMPKVGRPLAMVLLELPWERDDFMAAGRTLLEQTLPVMQEQGAENIEYVLDDPPVAPQFQRHAEKRMAFLEQEGFRVERETLRFELKKESCPAVAPCRSLTFRTLPEAGDEALIEAILRASQDTLDQRIREDREQMGERQQAVQMFEDLKEMEYDPAWWQLAYDGAGELVGFVIPAKTPTFASIAYIGVVPEQRGRGHIDALLQQGTHTLLAAGEPLIRTDTDVSNFPMAQAFVRAGYIQFCTRREYSKNIPAT